MFTLHSYTRSTHSHWGLWFNLHRTQQQRTMTCYSYVAVLIPLCAVVFYYGSRKKFSALKFVRNWSLSWTRRNTFCRTRSLSNATFSFLITWRLSSSKSAASVQNFMKIGLFFTEIWRSIFKMAAVRHFGIVLPPYETTHEVSVAGRSCLSNFMSIWYISLKI